MLLNETQTSSAWRMKRGDLVCGALWGEKRTVKVVLRRVEGVWYEGRVYHVREDFRSNPFQSISVLWMSQVC